MSDSNAIDEAILERARSNSLPFEIHDGWFKITPDTGGTPENPVIVPVSIPMPYANYLSSFGDDDARRLSGQTAQREKFFRLFHVGISREQVIRAIQMTRDRLEGHRLEVEDLPVGLIVVDSPPLIFRDDGAVREDGAPLFSGIDNYTVRFAIRRSL